MFFTYYLRNSSFQVYFLKHIRKIFFINSFCIYKNGKKFLSKTQQKTPKRNT